MTDDAAERAREIAKKLVAHVINDSLRAILEPDVADALLAAERRGAEQRWQLLDVERERDMMRERLQIARWQNQQQLAVVAKVSARADAAIERVATLTAALRAIGRHNDHPRYSSEVEQIIRAALAPEPSPLEGDL